MEFVARVVETDTRSKERRARGEEQDEENPMLCALCSILFARLSMEFAIPTDRRERVVNAFAFASTSPESKSMIAESVYVPPVSTPKPNFIKFWRRKSDT
jgi:hypothetical protein